MTKTEEIGVGLIVVLGLVGLYFYLKGPTGPIMIPQVATGSDPGLYPAGSATVGPGGIATTIQSQFSGVRPQDEPAPSAGPAFETRTGRGHF
jgi:hypothetical protein